MLFCIEQVPWLALGLMQQSRQEAAAVARTRDGLTVFRSAAVRSSVWECTVATMDKMQTRFIDIRAMAEMAAEGRLVNRYGSIEGEAKLPDVLKRLREPVLNAVRWRPRSIQSRITQGL